MCQPLSHLPEYVGQELGKFGQYSHDAITSSGNYLGRKIDSFLSHTLPNIVKETQEVCLEVIKGYFFVMPSLAFSLGHYSDVGVASLVCGISLVDWLLKDRDVREASAIFFGVPLALNLAIRTFRFISTGSSTAAVAVVLQAICLAKLVLIGKGENY